MDYILVDYYDVWGNKEDGWEVNDCTKLDNIIITITDDMNDEDIVKCLVDVHYFLPTVNFKNILIEWLDDNHCEISLADTYEPLCRLERV